MLRYINSYSVLFYSFGVAAACVWYNLPVTIRSATSLNTFKRHLKETS